MSATGCARRQATMWPHGAVHVHPGRVRAIQVQAPRCRPVKLSGVIITATYTTTTTSIVTKASCPGSARGSSLPPRHLLPSPWPASLSGGAALQHDRTALYGTRVVAVTCLPCGAADSGPQRPAFSTRHQRRLRRRLSSADSSSPASAAPGNVGPSGGGGGSGGSGPAPSAASSPVAPPIAGSGGGGGVVVAAAAAAAASSAVAVAVATRGADSGSESDYENLSSGIAVSSRGNHIVPFARRQPRALVLDCAYRPINVLTWYRAFHFDYFGKGEVLEYYPPPAVCTTGSGEFPLPAVLRVPQYTADMQDLCSRVACTRRNIMVRDGFCCQYCGSRRDLTIDHVHPASKGGRETWDNLVTACMRCNQRKSDRSLRELGWKLRRQPKEPSPYEIGIVAGVATSDILRPPPEWEAYIAPYRERLEMYRKAAIEAGLVNLIDDN